jgi:hypothetical protein
LYDKPLTIDQNLTLLAAAPARSSDRLGGTVNAPWYETGQDERPIDGRIRSDAQDHFRNARASSSVG